MGRRTLVHAVAVTAESLVLNEVPIRFAGANQAASGIRENGFRSDLNLREAILENGEASRHIVQRDIRAIPHTLQIQKFCRRRQDQIRLDDPLNAGCCSAHGFLPCYSWS
jgi:hypothetical protein